MLHKTSGKDTAADAPTDAVATPVIGTGETNQTLSLFGQSVTLAVLDDAAGIQATEQRLKQVYEAFLCATPLKPTGTALDIGAGSGEFAVPFARAFPGWTVWCFEPDAASFARLERNIAAQKLGNIKAVNVAIGTEPGGSVAKLGAALSAAKPDKLMKLCPAQSYQRSLTQAGYLEPGSAQDDSFETVQYATLPPLALVKLAPSLVKITAPKSEAAILQALGEAEVDHFIGELTELIASKALFSAEMKGDRLAYLPLTTPGELALRRWPTQTASRAGLDVVVAMYNTEDYILECVAGIVENTADEVHALVVDDGSTDGGAALVEKVYGKNPRVRVLRKDNGGCASARNYGRLMSDATHIAFVDADDVMDTDLFPQLLELARYTGCEVAQGGFDFLHMNPDGTSFSEDSYEQSEAFKAPFEYYPFADQQYCVLPASVLMVGQPTIWRRIYRRDFLDNRDIWFPEHIRAFDDQIFQMLSLQYADTIPALDHVRYHYRQHPGQDIKQGDERFFYSLEMFRTMVKRGVREGWNDFSSLAISYVNTVNWIHGGLRRDLKPVFLKGAAQLWALMLKTLSPGALAGISEKDFHAPDFGYYVAHYQAALEPFNIMYAWVYLDSIELHAPMMKMADPASFEQRDGKVITSPRSPLEELISEIGGEMVKTKADMVASASGRVSLSPLLEDEDAAATYLDGIVDSKSLAMVASTGFPFSGTSWAFQRGLDGSWMILNQGDADNCLADSDGVLGLRAHKAGVPGLPTRWHLFEYAGGFGLCTANGHLLALIDGAPTLIPLAAADQGGIIWRIEPL